MIDLMTIYLVLLLSIFCACVILIAISAFWDCFKEEIMQVKLSKANRKETSDE